MNMKKLDSFKDLELNIELRTDLLDKDKPEPKLLKSKNQESPKIPKTEKSVDERFKEEKLVTKVKLMAKTAKISLDGDFRCKTVQKTLHSDNKIPYGTWTRRSFDLEFKDFIWFKNCRANGMQDLRTLNTKLYPSLKLRTDNSLNF